MGLVGLKGECMSQELEELKTRLARRLANAMDVFSILVLDFIVIAVGYAGIKIAERFAHSGSLFFDAARRLSEVVFLCIYVVWVAFDFLDFLQQRRMEREIKIAARGQ